MIDMWMTPVMRRNQRRLLSADDIAVVVGGISGGAGRRVVDSAEARAGSWQLVPHTQVNTICASHFGREVGGAGASVGGGVSGRSAPGVSRPQKTSACALCSAPAPPPPLKTPCWCEHTEQQSQHIRFENSRRALHGRTGKVWVRAVYVVWPWPRLSEGCGKRSLVL
jgi:hypothetical protein